MKKFVFLLCISSIISFSYSQKWKEVNNEAWDAKQNGEYDKALELYLKALPMAKKEYSKKSAEYSIALNNLGNLYTDLGKYDLAETLMVEAVAIRKVVYGEDHPKYCIVLSNLARIYKSTSRFTEAETLYIQCCEIDKVAFGDTSLDYAYDLHYLARLYHVMGEFKKAEPLFVKAVELLRKISGVYDGEFNSAATSLANLYVNMGDFTKAETLYKELMTISKSLGENNVNYGIDLLNLGILYDNMGLEDKAEPLYQEATAIFKNNFGEMNIYYAAGLNSLAVLYTKMGNYDKAEQLFLQSTQIRKLVAGELSSDYAESISNTAELYTKMGQFDKAETLYKQALEINKKTFGEKNMNYAFCLNGLGMVYVLTYQYKEAEKLFLQNLAIVKEVTGDQSNSYGTALANIGTMYSYQLEFYKAEPMLIESMRIVKQNIGEQTYDYAQSLNSLGSLYLAKGDYEKAKINLYQATQTYGHVLGKEHPEFAKITGTYAVLNVLMRNNNEAAQLFVESDSLLLNYVQKVFTFTSEKEKVAYISTLNDYFQRSLSFAWQSHSSITSMNGHIYNQQLASRGLIQSSQSELKSRIFTENNDSVLALYNEWEKYNVLVAKEMSKPATSRSEYLNEWKDKSNILEKKLNQVSQLFKKENENLTISFNQIQSKLKPSEASIEFISFTYSRGLIFPDSILYVACILKSGDQQPLYVPLFEEKQLRGLLKGDSIRTFANLLYTDAQVRMVESEISYGDSLFQLIWKPLMPYLQNVDHVYYAPSGLLHGIAFDAIPMNETQLLSDKYRLSRLTTTAKVMDDESSEFYPTSVTLYGGIQYDMDTTAIRKNKRKEKKKNDNEDFNSSRSLPDTLSRGGSWNYLNGAKKEVDNIGNLLTQHKITSTIYTGEYGTEESIKDLDPVKSPSIIHFSTHGFFFPDPVKTKSRDKSTTTGSDQVFKYSEDPMFRSGLILAGANYVWKGKEPINGIEDGILTAYEISNLYLPNTKLVVMSACETGLGDVKGSEGVYGLQRAFKIAGVEYIIMTMWQVLDKETSEFMTLFYQNLLEKKSIPAAFKASQDNMKNKYRDEPYKWAGFVLIH